MLSALGASSRTTIPFATCTNSSISSCRRTPNARRRSASGAGGGCSGGGCRGDSSADAASSESAFEAGFEHFKSAPRLPLPLPPPPTPPPPLPLSAAAAAAAGLVGAWTGALRFFRLARASPRPTGVPGADTDSGAGSGRGRCSLPSVLLRVRWWRAVAGRRASSERSRSPERESERRRGRGGGVASSSSSGYGSGVGVSDE